MTPIMITTQTYLTKISKPYQSQEAGEGAALAKESPSQTKATHGPQNKIFPAFTKNKGAI